MLQSPQRAKLRSVVPLCLGAFGSGKQFVSRATPELTPTASRFCDCAAAAKLSTKAQTRFDRFLSHLRFYKWLDYRYPSSQALKGIVSL